LRFVPRGSHDRPPSKILLQRQVRNQRKVLARIESSRELDDGIHNCGTLRRD
jgi:hypothetical protein